MDYNERQQIEGMIEREVKSRLYTAKYELKEDLKQRVPWALLVLRELVMFVGVVLLCLSSEPSVGRGLFLLFAVITAAFVVVASIYNAFKST